MSTRKELEKKQAKILSEIKVIEKKLAVRKPKKEQADRRLATAKQEAVKRVEALHSKQNERLNKEIKTLSEELALKRKGYTEVSNDILGASNPAPERITVPPRTQLQTGGFGVPILD